MRSNSTYRYLNSHRYEDPRNLEPPSKKTVFTAVVILAVLVIATATLVYRADTANWPKIVSVEVVDSYPLSLREAETFRDEETDMFDLYNSEFDYSFIVTLENGKEYYIDNLFGFREYIDYYNGRIIVDAEISYTEALEKYKSSERTIDIPIKASLVQSGGNFSRYNTVNEMEITVKKDLVLTVVESVKRLSDKPVIAYDFSDIYDISGEKFEITYGDGRKTVATAQLKATPEGELYLDLDGIKAYVRWGKNDNELELILADSSCTFPCIERDFPIESIEITDCSFDNQYNFTSVTYTVTEKDGTSYSRTTENFYYYEGLQLYGCDYVKGYEVYLDKNAVYLNPFGSVKIKVKGTVGLYSDYEFSTVNTFVPTASECKHICHKNNTLVRLYYCGVSFIAKIFSIDKICECGMEHY